MLKDLVHSEIEGKVGVLNLLFYFLENTKFRYDYEVNTFNGLLQEDIDCSRVLAYYFLHPHDNNMKKFCADTDSQFYRFVDDMYIVVDDLIIGKKALKALTESFRRLGLIASIEKTAIMSRKKAIKELFFEENDILTEYEDKIVEGLKAKKKIASITAKVTKYYEELKSEKKHLKKNWRKVLKRFYTLLTYAKSDYLFNEISEHLVNHPNVLRDKLIKYLIVNQESPGFNKCVSSIVDYLYSGENLYPSLETSVIEAFLVVDNDSLDIRMKKRLRKLSEDMFFGRNDYSPLSDYARALACMLFYKFNKSNIEYLAKHYCNSNENSYVLKKYIIFVSSTINNVYWRKRIINKAKTEQNISIRRLTNFMGKIDTYRKGKLLKDYFKRDEICICYNEKHKFQFNVKYKPVRAEILRELIDIFKK